MDVTSLVGLGIQLRYLEEVEKGVSVDPGSVNYEKWNKYNRDILTGRSIIKCLACEIVTPCNCMNSKKVEAKGMDKTNVHVIVV